jgi:hypothetical protein
VNSRAVVIKQLINIVLLAVQIKAGQAGKSIGIRSVTIVIRNFR